MANINRNAFREYDIRGVYPSDIDEDTAYTIGRSYGSYLREKYHEDNCVIGHDNRLSSTSLTASLIKGIRESGVNVYDYGLITTPMHYFCRKIKKLPGIMVTASHNPKEYNGFKFSFTYDVNARGEMIQDFLEYTLKGDFVEGNGEEIVLDITDTYLSWLKEHAYMGNRRIKVVFDPGNGVTSVIIKQVVSMFDNIEPIYICDESDGTFPNHHPDPAVEENMEMLKRTVLETKADIGIGFDGDGDRIGVVTETGEWLETDKFMIMIIRDLIKKIPSKKFLYDVKCSKSLDDEIRALGGEPVIYRTGASYTEAKVLEDNIPFGGEYSGHVFFTDRGIEFGSAIYAALRVIEILSNNNSTVSSLLEGINKYYSTPEIKIATGDDTKFQVVEKVKTYCIEKGYKIIDIDGVRVEFNDCWALVRASNTGPNLTLRFEALSEERLKSLQDEFMQVVEQYNRPTNY